tara:strand:- start:278 stop:1237 length:960 start_codon:yes stop_codon:yes gene_type:complete
MARTVSDAFRETFSASSSDQVALVWLEISHASISTPIRVVLDTVPHGYGETATSTTLGINHAATSEGLSAVLVDDYANFSVGDNVRVELNNATATTLSATAASAATAIAVASVTGLAVHDPIKVALDSGTDYRTIRKISGTTVTIDTALSGAATSGNAVDKIGWTYGRVASKDTGAGAYAGEDVLTFVKAGVAPFTGADSGNAVQKLNEFLPFPFELQLGNSEPGTFTGARLRIDNVDRAILSSFRAIKPSDEAAEVVIRITLADTPETVEFETPPLAWRRLSYTNLAIEGELTAPAFFGSAYPATHFTPSAFPNLFAV